MASDLRRQDNLDSQTRSEIGSMGGQAAQRSGRAHRLTSEERSKGGRMSSGKFQKGSQRAREAGRKGGSM